MMMMMMMIMIKKMTNILTTSVIPFGKVNSLLTYSFLLCQTTRRPTLQRLPHDVFTAVCYV